MKRINPTFLNVTEFFHYVLILQLGNWNFLSPIVHLNFTVSVSLLKKKKMLAKHKYSWEFSLEIFWFLDFHDLLRFNTERRLDASIKIKVSAAAVWPLDYESSSAVLYSFPMRR